MKLYFTIVGILAGGMIGFIIGHWIGWCSGTDSSYRNRNLKRIAHMIRGTHG